MQICQWNYLLINFRQFYRDCIKLNAEIDIDWLFRVTWRTMVHVSFVLVVLLGVVSVFHAARSDQLMDRSGGNPSQRRALNDTSQREFNLLLLNLHNLEWN